jgi:hypothetical protein
MQDRDYMGKICGMSGLLAHRNFVLLISGCFAG